MKYSAAPTMNYISSGSVLHRTEQSRRDIPRFFLVPPSVLNLSSRESKALSFIHSLENCIYRTYALDVLVDRPLGNRIS